MTGFILICAFSFYLVNLVDWFLLFFIKFFLPNIILLNVLINFYF